jgi:curved DNA-binding protein CbpA
MARMDGIFDFRKRGRPSAEAPASEDLYSILGVSPHAGYEEIRAAYRKLGAKFHPDRNPGDRKAYEKFIEISRAHDVLSDPEKRDRYDQALRTARPASSSGEPRGLSTYFMDPAKKPAKGTKKKIQASRPTSMSMQDILFGPVVERGRAAQMDIEFPRGSPVESEWRDPGEFIFPPSVRVEMPSRERMIEGVRKLPLGKIWEFIGKFRDDPRFDASRTLVIGPIAGGGSDPVEQDLAILTGASLEQIAAFVERKGLDTAWRNILGPLAEQAVLAIESQKPDGLPGHFYVQWDDSGRTLELLYTELYA